MIAAVVVGLVIAYVIYDRLFRKRCDVPGPMGLPFVGYGPFLGAEPHVTMKNLSAKYGEVVLVRIGMKDVVVLNSLDAIKEAFARPEFCSRPNIFIFEVFNRHGGAFTFRPNDLRYVFLRKCAAKALANFTKSDKNLMPKLAAAGFAGLQRSIDASCQQPVNLRDQMTNMTISFIGSLSFGGEFDEDHPFFDRFKEWVREESAAGAVGAIAAFIPPLQPFLFRSRRKFERITDEVVAEQRRMISGHQRRSDGLILDIQDALAAVDDATQDSEARRKLDVSSDDISAVGMDIFGAGFGTTAEHLLMTVALLAQYPELQDRLYSELMAAGAGSDPQLEQRDQMPFFAAFQHELVRFFSHVPLSLHHAASKDATFRGYFIPEGTMVLSNLHAVHFDPQLFPEPHEFRPERFLNPDGSVNDLADKTVGFGVGLRKCPGELLARQELFLFTAKLVAEYKIQLHSFEGATPLDCESGLTTIPKNFSCIFEPRNQ